MTFALPIMLAGLGLLPLAVAAYGFAQRRRGRYAVRFSNLDLLANLVPDRPAWRRHLPPALYLLASAALIVALARPSAVVPVPRDDATVLLVVDVSGSMRATDVAPDRLTAAQAAANDFLAVLPAGVRVGLISFSGDPDLLAEPTTDRQVVTSAIARLRADGGTGMGAALRQALDVARPLLADSDGPQADRDSEPRPLVAAVLLSDGANTIGPEPVPVAEESAALGMPIHTIALGTTSGEIVIPGDDGQARRMQVPPDVRTLTAIAEATGATFAEAPTEADLAAIYEDLGSRVGFQTQEEEITVVFAAMALILGTVGAGFALHWFNRFP